MQERKGALRGWQIGETKSRVVAGLPGVQFCATISLTFCNLCVASGSSSSDAAQFFRWHWAFPFPLLRVVVVAVSVSVSNAAAAPILAADESAFSGSGSILL
jgi:hypothetical protein